MAQTHTRRRTQTGMRIEKITLLTLVATIHFASADLEHSCVEAHYKGIYARRCVMHVANFVLSRCIPNQNRIRIAFGQAPGAVFIGAEQASALLNYPIGNRRAGLSCECCANRCTVQELEQYCEGDSTQNRLRMRRSIQKRRSKHFTSAEVDEMYKAIDRSVTSSSNTPQISKLPLETFEQISKIKEWKLKNIEKKQLARFGITDTHDLSVNNSRPLSKVTNDESVEHASKPKLFFGVNKESPAPHHHRHKHLTQRDD